MKEKAHATHIAGLIVAGGYSSRMGAFKPLLPMGAKTVLETTVESLRRAGIHDIRVVVGHRAGELIPLLNTLQVTIIINEKYDEGMFSSITAGVASLARECEAFLLLPGDIPLVRKHSIRELLHAYRRTAASVVYPVFEGQRGHPPLIKETCFASILKGTACVGGLRSVLSGFEADSIEVSVADQGILMDMDTSEDYKKLLNRMQRRDIPSYEECLALLHIYQPDNDKVRLHGQKVASVALMLVDLLSKSGIQFDVELLKAAGIVHDLAKGKFNHAKRGERLLFCRGYSSLSALVGAHMDLNGTQDTLLDERAVLFLADKLVKGDRLVTLEQRFAPALQRFSQEADILARVMQKKKMAEALLRNIGKLTGRAVILNQGAR